MKDFTEFLKQNQTDDAIFKKGVGGVKEILVPKDKKSEFIVFEDKTLVNIKSLTGVSALYTLPKTSFQKKAKAVLMDLDGTSVQSESFWIWIIERTVARLLNDNNFKLEEEDMPFVSGFSVSEHLKYCINKYSKNERVERAREIYFEYTRYEMNEILHGRGKKDAFTPAKGLKEFLLTIKKEGIKIGLVTSGLYEKAMPEIISAFNQLKMGNPLEFYDAIITAGTPYKSDFGGTLGELSAKPHPWLYAELCKVGLNIDNEGNNHVIGIEDSSAGIMSVMLAGYEVIGMKGGNITEAGLDGLLYKKVDYLSEILKVII